MINLRIKSKTHRNEKKEIQKILHLPFKHVQTHNYIAPKIYSLSKKSCIYHSSMSKHIITLHQKYIHYPKNPAFTIQACPNT